MGMKTQLLILLILFLSLICGCKQNTQKLSGGELMPIIELSAFRDKPKEYVMLRLDYGIIIDNHSDYQNSKADY